MEQEFIDKIIKLLSPNIEKILIKFNSIVNVKKEFKLIHFEFIVEHIKRLTCACIIHDKYPNIIFMIGSNHIKGVYIRRCLKYGGYRITNKNIIYDTTNITDEIDIVCPYNLSINYLQIN